MVRPVIRDMDGRVIQQPDEFSDPDIFDTLEELRVTFRDMLSGFSDGGVTQIGGYEPPLIVQNFMQHARNIVPTGTVLRIVSTSRFLFVELSAELSARYTYEAIEVNIVRCLDHLKSITKAYHESRAQASPANTDNQAGRSASASVVPAPGARRMLLGRAKGPEGGEG